MRRSLAPLVAAAALAATAAPAAAQEPPTLAASGTGVAYLAPDQAELWVGVDRSAKSGRRARARVNRHLARLRRALRAQGVAGEDVQTSGISLYRDRVRRRNRRDRTIYHASSNLNVLVRDLERLGPVVDALTRAGASNLEGPSFSHSDPSQARIEATRLALADARRRAEDAAAQTGHRITGVQAIDLDPLTEMSFGDQSERASGGGAELDTDIDPGRLRFGALVKVVYTVAPA